MRKYKKTRGWNLAPYLSTKILPVRARTSAEGKLVCSVDVVYWCWDRLTRGGDVILQRIRLGYHCAWQIIDTSDHANRCCCTVASRMPPYFTIYRGVSKRDFRDRYTHHSPFAGGNTMPLAYILEAGAPAGNPATMESIQWWSVDTAVNSWTRPDHLYGSARRS